MAHQTRPRYEFVFERMHGGCHALLLYAANLQSSIPSPLNLQVPSSAWPTFVDAVLRKDYAVGYLLLMSVGQSTLVLSSLLASLALGSRSPRGQKVRGLR